MKNSKKKGQISQINSFEESVARVVSVGLEMPTADVVAAERASEAAYERELTALMLEESSDSGGSDGEARLRNALRPLQLLRPSTRALPPLATELLQPLAAALRKAHPQEVRFLDEYKCLLEERTEAEVQAVTEELMRGVEGTLLSAEGAGAGPGKGGVVVACWLCAAAVWRGPHVPRAWSALQCVLQQLSSHQVLEAARALHAAMEPRSLLAASDAVRGRRLAGLLQRAALADLLGLRPDWRAGAPGVDELRALGERWSTLGAEAQLAGLALAGRVLAGGARDEASALLAALTPPPPRDRHDPDYLRVSVAVKTLQNLVKET